LACGFLPAFLAHSFCNGNSGLRAWLFSSGRCRAEERGATLKPARRFRGSREFVRIASSLCKLHKLHCFIEFFGFRASFSTKFSTKLLKSRARECVVLL
jgi:hypothetical protein